jgi:hypothetical protein
VHLLVLIKELANQFTMHGTNNIKALFADSTDSDGGVSIALCHWLLGPSHEGTVNPELLFF